jgi:hypothetical protein
MRIGGGVRRKARQATQRHDGCPAAGALQATMRSNAREREQEASGRGRGGGRLAIPLPLLRALVARLQ